MGSANCVPKNSVSFFCLLKFRILFRNIIFNDYPFFCIERWMQKVIRIPQKSRVHFSQKYRFRLSKILKPAKNRAKWESFRNLRVTFPEQKEKINNLGSRCFCYKPGPLGKKVEMQNEIFMGNRTPRAKPDALRLHLADWKNKSPPTFYTKPMLLYLNSIFSH